MKREIKFKAKRFDGKGWVEGSLIRSTTGIKERSYIVDNFSSMSDYSVIGIDPSTVCQFTGMKDSEGNEIWEGDLLTYRYFKDIYEVVWGEDDAFFKIVNTRYRERTEPLGYSIRNIAWCVVGNKFDKK